MAEENQTPLDLPDVRANRIWEAVKYWEARRLKFNVAAGIGCLLLMLQIQFAPIVIAIPIMLLSNALYCAGFIVEAIDQHYFGGALNLHRFRNTLWWIGTLSTAIGLALFPLLFVILAFSGTILF